MDGMANFDSAIGIMHGLLLVGLSWYLFKRWEILERILCTFIALWANLITTSLILSIFSQLANSFLYCTVSVLLGCLALLIKQELQYDQPFAHVGSAQDDSIRTNSGKILLLGVIFGFFLVLNIVTVFSYPPNNYDSQAYHLPRIYFYLTQGNLMHFETVDTRQTFFPFNCTLLQMFVAQYGFPDRFFSAINLIAWLVSGLCVYKISLFLGINRFLSILSAWVGMFGTEVIAQATSTNNDLLLAAPLLCGIYLLLVWLDTQRFKYGVAGSMSLGIACGTKITMLYAIPGILILIVAVLFAKIRAHKSVKRIFEQAVPCLGLVLFFTLPCLVINLAEAGMLTLSLPIFRNTPWNFFSGLYHICALLLQMVLNAVFIIVPPLLKLLKFGAAENFTDGVNTAINRSFNRLFWNTDYSIFSNGLPRLFNPLLIEDYVWYGIGIFLVFYSIYKSLGAIRKDEDPEKKYFAFGLAVIPILWLGFFAFMLKWQPWGNRFFVAPYLLGASLIGFALRSHYNKNHKNIYARTTFYLFIFLVFINTFCYQALNGWRSLRGVFEGWSCKYNMTELPPLLPDISNEQIISFISSVRYGGVQRLYPFMKLGKKQKFIQPAFAQENCFNLIYNPTCVEGKYDGKLYGGMLLLNIPDKKRPGVAYYGRNDADWYGVENKMALKKGWNDNVLVSVYPIEENKLYVLIAGLFRQELHTVEVYAVGKEGAREMLASFKQSTGLAIKLRNQDILRFNILVYNDATHEIVCNRNIEGFVQWKDPGY